MDPAEHFASLINRPSDEVHLDLLAALVGASFDPLADVEAVRRELDELAGRYEPTFEAIMAGLFGSGLLRGNSHDYGDPRNSFLHDVLTRRLGLPITLSVVAIEVGRRANVPIAGVGLPGHFIVRDTDSGRFGDPFHGGRIYEHDEVGPAWQRITMSGAPLRPGMLLPTPPRSIVLRILNNLRNTMLQRNDEHGLGVLADLRGAFPELAGERPEHAHWKRIWN
jgi:regulator of sirC expression with transglutaminase-like and TPR domain